ncbi:MAG: response regulator transcription factor [Armatimonadetes bacterium]|nr:response regulator transcription factor [Armatimonadota bacterium]
MAINAFVGTDEPVSVLVQAIQAAAQNRLYCSPQLLPALIDAVGGNGDAPSGGGASRNGAGSDEENSNASQAALLSAREHEVALHAARGLSNEQIAVFLGISIPTVKFHLMHSFRKLGIQRRTQLYAYMPFLTSATEALLPPVVE